MSDYIDLLVAAGWIEPEPCKYCKNTRKGYVVHDTQDLTSHTPIDCWHCTDPDAFNKHVKTCQRCVFPFKRRGGGQSLVPPPNFKPTPSPYGAIENPETGRIKPMSRVDHDIRCGHQVIGRTCTLCGWTNPPPPVPPWRPTPDR